MPAARAARALGAALLVGLACACDDDPAPAAPAPVATCDDKSASNYGAPLPCIAFCVLNHTGTLLIDNRIAPLGYVYVDGAFLTTLAYGAEYRAEVAAGVRHVLELQDPTTRASLFRATPIVVQCGSVSVWIPMGGAPRGGDDF